MTDICLVCMPLASVERPSMALGLLKAHLARGGIDAAVCHANLWYLDFAGLTNLRMMDRSRPDEALVDWIFSGCVFPSQTTEPDVFLEQFAQRNPRFAASAPHDWRERLITQKRVASQYIDWAADKVLMQEPHIVGCTSTFQQHMASLALLKRIRERAPDVVTMMGGGNCESMMGRTTHREFPWVDYVSSGEADDVIVDLVAAALEFGREIPAGRLPTAIFAPFHREEGYPTIASADGVPRNSVATMANMPVPDFDDYFDDLDDCLWKPNIRPGLPVETSRGCWWGQVSHCTFCGLNGGNMNFRSKDPDRVVEELDQLSRRYGLRSIETVDNILDMDYLKTVLVALAERKPPYNLFFEIKSNLKRDQVATLAAAGVHWVQPGIESLDSDVLALMGKGAKAWSNLQLLKWCRQFGVRMSWNLICDFPGEDDAAYRRMAERVPLLAHLQPGNIVALRYDRFSPYFSKREQYGLDLVPSAMYRMVYPFDDEVLADLVYFFELRGRKRSVAPNGILPPHLEARPGTKALVEAMTTWLQDWSDGSTPVLLVQPDGEGAVLTDTRPIAKAAHHRLDALAFAVLRGCDLAPPSTGFAAKSASGLGTSPEAVEHALRILLERDLVMEIDRRYVALPLMDPVPDLP
ncbi:MAG: RiPP maturation radical SAM protein 1, partial [Rhodospirillaceae bacterium]|nr:RiPP maturation radical SAM protein 1 [Rhodospirillaceae bacterium]